MSTSITQKGNKSPPESLTENLPFIEQNFLLDLHGRVVTLGDSSPSGDLVGMVVRVTRSASRLVGGGLVKSPEVWVTHGAKILYCGFVHEGTLACLLNSNNPLPSLPPDAFEQIRLYLARNQTNLHESSAPLSKNIGEGADPQEMAKRLAECQKLLAEYIGPAAGYVFYKAINASPEGANSRSAQILQSVADKIADPAKRAEFLARASKITGL